MRFRQLPKPLLYTSVVATTMAGALLLKDYMGGKKYMNDEILTDKVVVITGANTGIGRETALEFANRKAKVIMACRNLQKCEKARRDIVLESRNKYVYCRKCDLASFDSIKAFVKRFKSENSKLHILINNGGVMRCPKDYTKEGIEMQLGVNHMGHFLLTNLLLDVIKDSAPARIINITSAAHKRGTINVKDLNSTEKYDPTAAYNQSKLANILFTKELAKKLAGTGVTVNAVYPGIADTDINRHLATYNSYLFKIFVKPFMWPFIKTPRQASQGILYVALDPSFENVTGKYISNGDVIEESEDAKNEKLAKWLWLTSEKWTRLNVS